jgi:hypothetical protein
MIRSDIKYLQPPQLVTGQLYRCNRAAFAALMRLPSSWKPKRDILALIQDAIPIVARHHYVLINILFGKPSFSVRSYVTCSDDLIVVGMHFLSFKSPMGPPLSYL